jgi:hypothetical protein
MNTPQAAEEEFAMTFFGGTFALAAVLAALAMPAAAQQTGQGSATRTPGQGMMGQGWMGQHMMGPGMMDMPMMQGMRPGMMMGGPGQHIEGRLAFLKAELGITPEQEQVWNAYADALRETATSMQGMHDQMMSGGMPATLPERLERHEQMMTARLDALEKTKATAVPLYNALSPEQKQAADAFMMGMGMM